MATKNEVSQTPAPSSNKGKSPKVKPEDAQPGKFPVILQTTPTGTKDSIIKFTQYAPDIDDVIALIQARFNSVARGLPNDSYHILRSNVFLLLAKKMVVSNIKGSIPAVFIPLTSIEIDIPRCLYLLIEQFGPFKHDSCEYTPKHYWSYVTRLIACAILTRTGAPGVANRDEFVNIWNLCKCTYYDSASGNMIIIEDWNNVNRHHVKIFNEFIADQRILINIPDGNGNAVPCYFKPHKWDPNITAVQYISTIPAVLATSTHPTIHSFIPGTSRYLSFVGLSGPLPYLPAPNNNVIEFNQSALSIIVGQFTKVYNRMAILVMNKYVKVSTKGLSTKGSVAQLTKYADGNLYSRFTLSSADYCAAVFINMIDFDGTSRFEAIEPRRNMLVSAVVEKSFEV